MGHILQVLVWILLVTTAWGWHHSTYVNEPGGRVDGQIDRDLLTKPDAPNVTYFHERQAEQHSVDAQAAYAVVGTANAFLALSRAKGMGHCWGKFLEKGSNESSRESWGNCANMNFTGIKAVFTNAYSFFALRKDGTGVCFGRSSTGGNCTGLNFIGVTHVYAIRTAFMVLKIAKGQATTGFCWGKIYTDDHLKKPAPANCSGLDFTGVTTVYTNGQSFVGLRVAEDKYTTHSFCYGCPSKGANCTGLDFTGVTAVFATGEAYLALRGARGELTTGFCWGNEKGGGNCLREPDGDDKGKSLDFHNTVAVFPTYYAFLAVKHDGSGLCWGATSKGVDMKPKCENLSFKRVATVRTSDYAFVALEQPGGEGFCWGETIGGANCEDVNKTGITHLYVTYRSFLYLKQSENKAGCWGDPEYGCHDPTSVYDFSHVTVVYATGSRFLVLKDKGPAKCIGTADGHVDGCTLFNSWIEKSNIMDVDAPACHVKHSNMQPGLLCRCDPGYANFLITLPSNRLDGNCMPCKEGRFNEDSKIQAKVECAECPSGRFTSKPLSSSCKAVSYAQAYIACVAFCLFEIVLILGLVCVAYNETKLCPGELLQNTELVDAERPLLEHLELDGSRAVEAVDRCAVIPVRDKPAEATGSHGSTANSMETNNVLASLSIMATLHAASWCCGWRTCWRPCAARGIPAPCDLTATKRLYWNEVILVAAEAYTMMSVIGLVFLQRIHEFSDSSITTHILMYIERVFHVALFDFASHSFEFEFAFAWLFPLVVAVSYFVGWRKAPWSLSGVYDLGQFKPVQVLFDACSLPVVKTLISASICKYSSPDREPYLVADENILCQSRQQSLIALAGWLGTSIFFLWLVTTILRKSTKSDARLYDFLAISVLVNTKAILGIATALLRHSHPMALLAITCLITGSLLSMCLAHPGPCRFVQVNHYRRVSLCLCFVTSQLVLLYEMEMGAQASRAGPHYDHETESNISTMRMGLVFFHVEVIVFAVAYKCTKYWLAWEGARRNTSDTSVVPSGETQVPQIDLPRSASAPAQITVTRTPTALTIRSASAPAQITVTRTPTARGQRSAQDNRFS